MNSKSDTIDAENENIKVNKDGTISPIDPAKPSRYTFKPSVATLEKEIEAILLDMEWCHAVKTESLEKAKAKLKSLLLRERLDELQRLKNCGHYPFYSDEAENYVSSREAELSRLSEEESHE